VRGVFPFRTPGSNANLTPAPGPASRGPGAAARATALSGREAAASPQRRVPPPPSRGSRARTDLAPPRSAQALLGHPAGAVARREGPLPYSMAALWRRRERLLRASGLCRTVRALSGRGCASASPGRKRAAFSSWRRKRLGRVPEPFPPPPRRGEARGRLTWAAAVGTGGATLLPQRPGWGGWRAASIRSGLRSHPRPGASLGARPSGWGSPGPQVAVRREGLLPPRGAALCRGAGAAREAASRLSSYERGVSAFPVQLPTRNCQEKSPTPVVAQLVWGRCGPRVSSLNRWQLWKQGLSWCPC